MSCGELVGGEAGMVWRVLEDVVAEAVNHAPSLIILDDLDGLIPFGLEGPKPATTVVALAEFLGDLIDLYQVYFVYLANATGLCLVISTVLATVLIRRDWNPELIYLNGQFVTQGGGQKDNGRPAIVFFAIARSPNTLPSSLCLSGNFFLLFPCPSVVLAKVLPITFALEKSIITFKD
jgi:hypothetical protein